MQCRVLLCNTSKYSVYCPFIVRTPHQPCAKMNLFFVLNGSYLSTPGSLRFQSDPIHLHESMDCDRAGVLVLKCRLLICPNYKVTVSQTISRNCSLSWIVVKKVLKANIFQPIYSSAKSQSVVEWLFDSKSMLS